MRFLYFGIGFNLTLLGLTATNLAATAATPAAPVPYVTSIERVAIVNNNQTLIKGNGVEFTLPQGFKGGSPSSAQTRKTIAAAAKRFPTMASMMQVLDSDPTIVRAIATNTSARSNQEMVIVSRLPVPASVSLTDLQDAMSKTIPAMLPPEFQLVDNQILNVGSRQIIKMEIAIDIQGTKVRESIGLFKLGDEVFQVTYVYASENAQQAMPIFDRMIATFKTTANSASPAAI